MDWSEMLLTCSVCGVRTDNGEEIIEYGRFPHLRIHRRCEAGMESTGCSALCDACGSHCVVDMIPKRDGGHLHYHPATEAPYPHIWFEEKDKHVKLMMGRVV